jgi:hypothetical protein
LKFYNWVLALIKSRNSSNIARIFFLIPNWKI